MDGRDQREEGEETSSSKVGKPRCADAETALGTVTVVCRRDAREEREAGQREVGISRDRGSKWRIAAGDSETILMRTRTIRTKNKTRTNGRRAQRSWVGGGGGGGNEWHFSLREMDKRARKRD